MQITSQKSKKKNYFWEWLHEKLAGLKRPSNNGERGGKKVGILTCFYSWCWPGTPSWGCEGSDQRWVLHQSAVCPVERFQTAVLIPLTISDKGFSRTKLTVTQPFTNLWLHVHPSISNPLRLWVCMRKHVFLWTGRGAVVPDNHGAVVFVFGEAVSVPTMAWTKKLSVAFMSCLWFNMRTQIWYFGFLHSYLNQVSIFAKEY